MRLIVSVLILVLGSGSAFAEDPCAELQKQYSAIGVALCAEANFDKSDEALNKVYKSVVAFLKEEGRDLKPLITAERAWITERDARCNERAKEEDLIDRTGDGAIIDCKTKWTKDRIATLNDYLEP
jgi:uncharacterized protein YecT (DUF1311 family)